MFLLLNLMYFFFLVFMFLGVAFLTFYERHLLGLSQNRKGPMKVSFMGILQALFDGLKLFKKDFFFPFLSFNFFYFFLPLMVFFVLFLDWLVLPFGFFFFSFSYSFLFFLCMTGVLVYFMLLMGVFSKSKYTFLGSVRSSSQSISFEVVFFFFFFCFVIFFKSFFFFNFFNFFFIFIIVFFLILVLVELNRAPFDFSEGESELVSGFNLEYSSIFFIFLFLSEYGFMLFFSVLLSCFFNFFFSFFFFTFFLFIRSVYPRYRYDLLMYFFWIVLLPMSMNIFFFFYFLFSL